MRNFPLPHNRLYLPISRHSQKQQSSLSTTAQRSSRLCIPGSPGFFGWYMACRPNRSIPAHSIPVTPTPRGLSSSLHNNFYIRPCEPRSRLLLGLFCSNTLITQGLPAAQAVRLPVRLLVLVPVGHCSQLFSVFVRLFCYFNITLSRKCFL